jgi:hypothetical protein
MAACATNCSTSPHSLGYQTPTAFARTFNATADRLRNPDQLCDRPLLRGALAPISAGVTAPRISIMGGSSAPLRLLESSFSLGSLYDLPSSAYCPRLTELLGFSQENGA